MSKVALPTQVEFHCLYRSNIKIQKLEIEWLQLQSQCPQQVRVEYRTFALSKLNKSLSNHLKEIWRMMKEMTKLSHLNSAKKMGKLLTIRRQWDNKAMAGY